MPVSQKLRFEVFKRDNFTCQYCGNHPPEIILECDHIQPVSKGGKDDINNLITSCFDCNRGKSNVELSSIPNTLEFNKNILIEKENQYKAYQKALKKVENRIKREISGIEDLYQETYPNSKFTKRFKNISIRMFLDQIGYDQVYFAMDKATSYIDESPEDCLSYFCGICWKIIKKQ